MLVGYCRYPKAWVDQWRSTDTACVTEKIERWMRFSTLVARACFVLKEILFDSLSSVWLIMILSMSHSKQSSHSSFFFFFFGFFVFRKSLADCWENQQQKIKRKNLNWKSHKFVDWLALFNFQIQKKCLNSTIENSTTRWIATKCNLPCGQVSKWKTKKTKRKHEATRKTIATGLTRKKLQPTKDYTIHSLCVCVCV